MGTQMRICEECVCCAAAAEVCELHGFLLVSALPLFKLMSQLRVALHELVESVSGNSAFRQSVGCHIACINPENVLKNAFVQKFSKILSMTEERLFCWLLDNCGCNCGEDGLCVDIQS